MKRLLILFLLLAFHAYGDHPYFSNGYYQFYFKAKEDAIRILSAGGDTLVASSVYHQELIDSSGDTIRMHEFVRSNYFTSGNPQSYYTWMDSSAFCMTVFRVYFDSQTEELKVTTESTFLRPAQVIRDALILDMHAPLHEVFKRNSILDSVLFQDEYWLNKEGAQFGEQAKTFLLYHSPEVSSIQLNTLKNQLIINLDYAQDHPFQHFPARDSMMHEKEDYSCSIYKAGDVRRNAFVIHAGKKIDHVPRLMLSPYGFLASHVFTEHADWTDLPTHQAVYFGSEEIHDSKNATGGFVKNKIPVTKSVFYANPDGVKNNESSHKSIFTSPIANIKSTKNFTNFLKQLQAEGNEICLHTPDQFTSNRRLLEEACTYMKNNFNSVTWIDHGYNNGPKNNREAFVCDGLNPASPYFAKDIWEKDGLKYFWNSYYEDFPTPDSEFFDFNSSIMHPYPGFGDAAPAPLYWKSPTRTGNFYSWPTRDLLEVKDAHTWNFLFSEERLNDFVQQRGVKFQHCYPAGSIVGSGFWKFNAEKKLVIDPEFEKVLERLAAYRDKGLINLTTVRDLLDYWTACEHVIFNYANHNTVEISNTGKGEIKGISFAVDANQVTSVKPIQQKRSGDDLIFWFDLAAGEKASFTFSK